MTVVVFAGLVVLALLWLRRRARKARVLAGLVAERPTFSIEPPLRSIGRHGRETL